MITVYIIVGILILTGLIVFSDEIKKFPHLPVGSKANTLLDVLYTIMLFLVSLPILVSRLQKFVIKKPIKNCKKKDYDISAINDTHHSISINNTRKLTAYIVLGILIIIIIVLIIATTFNFV